MFQCNNGDFAKERRYLAAISGQWCGGTGWAWALQAFPHGLPSSNHEASEP